MRKLILAVLMLPLLPAVAYSQTGHDNTGGPPTLRTDKEKQNDAAIEKAYEEAVKRERERRPPGKADPWGNVRSTGSDNTKH